MYLVWIYLHGICHLLKKYENAKMSVARLMGIAEYIYGLKSTKYIEIPKRYSG